MMNENYCENEIGLMYEDDEYLTTTQAAEYTGLSKNRIAKACYGGQIKNARHNDQQRQYLIPKSSIDDYLNNISPNLVFGDIRIQPNENLRPITSYYCDIFDSFVYEFAFMYLASDQGNIYNFSSGCPVTIVDDETRSYLRVALIKKENGKHIVRHVDIHRLVAYAFCPRRPDRNCIHHININAKDNRAKNLIWVTSQEHHELHNLYKNNKSFYRKRIKEIQKENKQY